jgi:uncharacterized protein YcbK (DUF882 family)
MTTYKERLEAADVLGHGFAYTELVSWKGLHRKRMPPRYMWDRIIPAMQFANALRWHMVAAGARGLNIVAAYRPIGGAKYSQHKYNRALDLDLLRGDYHLATEYYRVAAGLYESVLADGFRAGLGFYCGPTATGGIRVHIDVGRSRSSSWTISGGKQWSPSPLLQRILSQG